MSKFDYKAEVNEAAPYKKKSDAAPPKKSKHKHIYEPCLISRPAEWYLKDHLRSGERKLEFRLYCPICGKLDYLDDKHRARFYTRVQRQTATFRYLETVLTAEGEREMNPETRTLPYFEIDDPFEKFVDIGKEEVE